MHPMAAYCVLKGLRAVKPNFAVDEDVAYRIRSTMVGVGRLLFYYDTLASHWLLSPSVTYSRQYREVGFDTIPDAVLDKLTVDLVDNLAEAA